MPDTNCTLQVNGKNYGGWMTVRVTLAMETIAGTFELSISDRWPGQLQAWPIKPGDSCRLLAGKESLIFGYVDDVNPSYDAFSHEIRIAGRDKTGDLVDCSAIYKTGDWHGASLLTIARDICKPFGIDVKSETDLGANFTRWSLQEGETAFEALERAAKMRGVLLVSDGNGRLLLTRASTKRIETALVKGQNIETANANFSHRDRFSQYIVKGQSPGTDWSSPTQNARTKAVVADDDIKRYRPLIVIAEQGNKSAFEARARWERNVRIGRGSRVAYLVTGWEHKTGIWRPNVLCGVRDDFLGVDGDLLICSVSLTLDEGGTHSEITVCRPESFELPPPEKEKAKGKKGGSKKKKEVTAW